MGCCSSRGNDDGNQEFTKNSQDLINEALAKKEDLVKQIKGLYDKGWRFHHVDNDGKTYVTKFVEVNLENVLESDQLTISELALSQNNNAKHIFSNVKILEKISAKYYEAYGFEVKDHNVINEFNEAEAKISDDNVKNVYRKIRVILNIPQNVVADQNKDHNKEVHQDHDDKQNEVHHDDKQNEVHHDDKQKEVHHDDKQNEVHNSDTNAQVHS